MGPDQAGNPMLQMIPFIVIFFIFYFLVIKPEKQKQKDKKAQISKIKKNDQIVTAGGIHGTVVMVKDTTVVARVDDNTRIEFDKEAITAVTSK